MWDLNVFNVGKDRHVVYLLKHDPKQDEICKWDGNLSLIVMALRAYVKLQLIGNIFCISSNNISWKGSTLGCLKFWSELVPKYTQFSTFLCSTSAQECWTNKLPYCSYRVMVNRKNLWTLRTRFLSVKEVMLWPRQLGASSPQPGHYSFKAENVQVN